MIACKTAVKDLYGDYDFSQNPYGWASLMLVFQIYQAGVLLTHKSIKSTAYLLILQDFEASSVIFK